MLFGHARYRRERFDYGIDLIKDWVVAVFTRSRSQSRQDKGRADYSDCASVHQMGPGSDTRQNGAICPESRLADRVFPRYED
jgi:hypothetical protein